MVEETRVPRAFWVAAIALAAVCFVAGWMVGREGDVVPITERGAERAAREVDPLPPAPIDPRVPTASRPPGLKLDVEAIAEFTRRIAETKAAQPTIERPWPYQPGRDGPQQWPERMAEVFAECGGGMTLRDTHCTDFPCVATVQADEWTPGLVVKLTDLFGEDCAPLLDDMPDAEHGVLMDFTVDCPDGATETMLVFATGDLAPLVSAFPEATDEDIVQRLMMDLSRRSDTLAANWECGTE